MVNTYYESQKDILTRMLNKQNLSTNEGDISYILQSPIAIELENIKLKQDEIVNRNNIIGAFENGYEQEVIKYAEQDGIDRKTDCEATGIETFYGTIGTVIKTGTKFGNEATGLMYKTVLDGTIGEDGSVDILSVSIEKGAKYNAKYKTLNYMPIKLVGITGCTNKDEFKNGRDVESIDDLFYRHQLKTRKPSASGNKYDYESWALEVDNVGYAKCITAVEENNVGVVKVIIANSNKRSADEALIKKTYDYIEEVRPVLAGTLKVETVTEVNIDIDIEVEIENSVTLNDIKTKYIQAVEEYFDDKVYTTKKISIAKLQSILIDIDGVIDCSEIKINNSTSNITLDFDEVAVLKNVQLGVI